MERRSFLVTPRAPFRLDLTAWALRRRPENVIDRWDGHAYRRVLALPEGPVEAVVVQEGTQDEPRLAVTLAGARVGPTADEVAQELLGRMLGLQLDVSGFYRLAAGDDFLASLAERFRGIKPPRLPTLFECLVNAIACQQLTLTIGIRLLNQLAETYGSGLDGAHAFPQPSELARVEADAVRLLGFSGAKARNIVALAVATERGELDDPPIRDLDDEAALAALRRLRGIGRWSAEYALLRGLGRLHVFPGDDVGARNNLARRLGISGPLDYAAVREAVRPWQPYAGLVYFHLLLANLVERGLLDGRGA